MCLLNRLVVAIKSNLRLASPQPESLGASASLFGVPTTILIYLFHRKQQQDAQMPMGTKGDIAGEPAPSDLSRSPTTWRLIFDSGISA